MAIILIDELYKKIIQQYSRISNNLNIISGYGSSKFLSMIIEEFPNLQINLFIGMSQTGISFREHQSFLILMGKHEKLSIYYQVKGPLTHIKLLEFSTMYRNTTFLGSANFTENGFINNHEAMVCLNEQDNSNLFERQKSVSLLCTDPDIENKIKFYEESTLSTIEPDTESFEHVNQHVINEKEEKKYDRFLEYRKSNKIPTKYNLTVVLNENNDPNWASNGINAIFKNKKSFLIQRNSWFFNSFFPKNHSFILLTESGQEFKAQLSGDFERHLELVDMEFYEYFSKILGFKDSRPISEKDLENIGMNKIYFEKKEESIYLMYFDSKN